MTNCYRAGVKLQTLFNKFGVKYFEVEPALSNVSNGDVLAHFISDFLPVMPGDSQCLL
jgi:hypothetical protein